MVMVMWGRYLLANALAALSWNVLERVSWIAAVVAVVVPAAVAGRTALLKRRTRRQMSVRIGRIPPEPAWFQQRPDLLGQPGARWRSRNPGPTQVLSGLGGVGKTQIAAAFARQAAARGDLKLLVWIPVCGQDSIITAYAEAARALALVDDQVHPQQAADQLMVWLEHTDQNWLIVWDKLDNPADAADWWPPVSRHGRTVVTTRRRDAVLDAGRRILITVDLFTAEESVAYLRRAVGKPVQRQHAIALAKDLDHLPLALAQAAAFIRDRELDCVAYRRRLGDVRLGLADVVPPEDGLPDNQRTTLAATWALSIEAADKAGPPGLAHSILNLACLLQPEAIPLAFFTSGPAIDYITLEGELGQESDILDALHTLDRLNLVTCNERTALVQTHVLIQRAIRDDLDADSLDGLAWIAADALLEIWPEVEPDRLREQMLRANALVLFEAARGSLIEPRTHRLHFRTTDSLVEAGNHGAATAILRQLFAEQTRLIGADHADSLTTRRHLASAMEENDPREAAAAYGRLLDDCVRIMGPGHSYTLVTRCEVVKRDADHDDPQHTLARFEELLGDCRRILGPDDPVTLGVQASLANWHGETGHFDAANEVYHEVLAAETHIFGPDHPTTLRTRNNLLCVQQDSGSPLDASVGFRELAEEYTRVFGPDHPLTLATRANLAFAIGAAGDVEGAADACRTLVDDYAQVFGADHFEVSVMRLALSYWQAHVDAAWRTKGVSPER
ncbi:tetratricopeptide repeat protein [Plantactinospora solaniradicis]|uniref:Tetratricopeptide repeat protein n=1 Tax=Plantactinospora solaniradicis TaxID=1723736 RepID=A0ABW1KBQ9_9ACTN